MQRRHLYGQFFPQLTARFRKRIAKPIRPGGGVGLYYPAVGLHRSQDGMVIERGLQASMEHMIYPLQLLRFLHKLGNTVLPRTAQALPNGQQVAI